jgi:hypothetical protein
MSLLGRDKVSDWVSNVPDYYDMTAAYSLYGELKAQVIRLKREIERVEEQVAIQNERPRSNQARAERLQATSVLKDALADAEAQTAVQESVIKSLEYRKAMFASATYSAKLRFEVPNGDDV